MGEDIPAHRDREAERLKRLRLPMKAEANLPLEGRTIADKFLIESAIGQGAMGAVYRAQGNQEEAQRCLRRALKIHETTQGGQSPEAIEDLHHLAGLLEERGTAIDRKALLKAVELAKTDLTTELVKEFTELQGIVGGLYARAQGLGEKVAQAIYWQYSPAAVEDPIPPTVEGQVLGVADRIQTIVAMFSIGLEPTGSKDPFALRRAANAIVKILAESSAPLPLSLDEIATAAVPDKALALRVRAFLAERLDFYLREARDHTYDVVKAVLAAGSNDEATGQPHCRARAVVTSCSVAKPSFSIPSPIFSHRLPG